MGSIVIVVADGFVRWLMNTTTTKEIAHGAKGVHGVLHDPEIIRGALSVLNMEADVLLSWWC
jgi:phage-related protein